MRLVVSLLGLMFAAFSQATTSTRPTGAIFFQPNFCGCKDGQSILISTPQCQKFCEDRPTNGQERLYVDFAVGPEIISSGLGSVHGWCTKDIGSSRNPSCEMEARSYSPGSDDIERTMIPIYKRDDNSFWLSLDMLNEDQTYIITLKEISTNASTDSVQIRKLSTAPTWPTTVLSVDPVLEYACVDKAWWAPLPNVYDNRNLQHGYFVEQYRPDPMPWGLGSMVCHDALIYGNSDSALFPRLHERRAFNLWSQGDARFFDLDGNGSIDIEDEIRYRSGIPTVNRFFGKIHAPIFGQNYSSNLGSYMRYFLNQETYQAFCPTQSHYQTANPLFRILGDILQLDTEGIYLAKREVITAPGPDGQVVPRPNDYIILSETDLRASWFYIQQGVPKQPSRDAIGERVISKNVMHVYYPLNQDSPLVRHSNQSLYTVINNSTKELPEGLFESYGWSYPAHDKRFGCVPKSRD